MEEGTTNNKKNNHNSWTTNKCKAELIMIYTLINRY